MEENTLVPNVGATAQSPSERGESDAARIASLEAVIAALSREVEWLGRIATDVVAASRRSAEVLHKPIDGATKKDAVAAEQNRPNPAAAWSSPSALAETEIAGGGELAEPASADERLDAIQARVERQMAAMQTERSRLQAARDAALAQASAFQDESARLGGAFGELMETHLAAVQLGKSEAAALSGEVERLRGEMYAFRSSTSWKVTAPLRAFLRIMK